MNRSLIRSISKARLAGVAALLALAAGLPAAASAQQVVVQIGPPAPVYEVAPAPRHNQVWVQGHHEWRHGRYVWVPGYWVAQRTGYVYEQPHWVQRGGQWVYVAGNWAPHRGHPGRGRGHDRDRDGDGVPDRFDRYPNNPRRG